MTRLDKLTKSLSKTEMVVDGAVTEYIDQLTLLGKLIYDDIVKFLEKLDIVDGNVVLTENSYFMILELQKKIGSILSTNIDNKKIFTIFEESFNEINGLVKEQQVIANDLKVSNKYIAEKTKGYVKITRDNFSKAAFNPKVLDPMKKGLFLRLNSGTPLGELKTFLKGELIGTDIRGAKLTRYASQTASDIITQYNGTINQSINSDNPKLDAIFYENSLVKGSRAQCVRWVEKYKRLIKKSILKAEIEWANTQGKGMIPNTTVNNFLVYRGGYDCRHNAIAVNYEKWSKLI